MPTEAASAGYYTSPAFGTTHPRVQLLTVDALLAGKKLDVPSTGGSQGLTVALPPTPQEVHPDQMTLGGG